MKYRHSYHAGNFADVHKHVTLLALIGALQKKDKGFFYLDTHAGRGSYDLSSPTAEAAGGIGRLTQAVHEASELRAYASALATLRGELKQRHLYAGSPLLYAGSPLLAVGALRPQDRAVLIELEGGEAHSLEAAVTALAEARAVPLPPVRVERGDGFQRLKAWLPPPERRGLTFIDPPYEEPEDFGRVSAALAEGLRRFPTGVQAAWYPIKDERTSSAWQAGCARTLGVPILASELWLFRRDSRVALNGSGLLIVNPPHLILERMQVWVPELLTRLRSSADAGSSARMLSESG
jgi:23S rRNA (adenine2030-N6)-methyltransferase